MKRTESKKSKPLFPSVAKFLHQKKTVARTPLPSQSRLPQASSSRALPTPRTFQEPSEPPTNQGYLIRENTDMVTAIRNRLAAGRKERFFFLTIPGIIRVIQVLSGILNIAAFAFYCTFYEDVVEFVIPPFFLSTTREVFFTMATFNSLIGGMCLIIAGIFNTMSNRAIISSLYPFVFDLIQFLLVIASSISNIQFYDRNYPLLLKIAPKGLHVKNGIAFSGIILALLHFISGIYDIIFFMKRLEYMKDKDEDEDELEAISNPI